MRFILYYPASTLYFVLLRWKNSSWLYKLFVFCVQICFLIFYHSYIPYVFLLCVSSYLLNRFDFRAFRWIQTMVFAIEEINNISSLLPGVTLGYRILDSCDYVHTSLRSTLALVNGTTQAVGSAKCLSTAPVSAVIGLASSSPTRAVAHTLGPFGIPLVRIWNSYQFQTYNYIMQCSPLLNFFVI